MYILFSLCTHGDVCACVSVRSVCKRSYLTTFRCVYECVSPLKCWWNIRYQGWGKWNEMTKPNTNGIKIPKYIGVGTCIVRQHSYTCTHSRCVNNTMVSLTVIFYSLNEWIENQTKKISIRREKTHSLHITCCSCGFTCQMLLLL